MTHFHGSNGTDKIRQITVSGLFGVFDHVIPLNHEGITIIHGLNGYGKTLILRLLDGLSHHAGQRVANLPVQVLACPFHSVEIDFVNGERILLYGSLQKGLSGDNTYQEQVIPAGLPPTLLINTERLRFMSGKGHEETRLNFSVTHQSKQLALLIQKKLAEFGTLSQHLESSFPNRLIDQMGHSEADEDTIKARLEAIKKTRRRLAKVGILPAEQHPPIPETRINESTRAVLAIYANDTEAKLGVFEETAAKIELLLDIVNQRFKYKSMEIGRDGYRFLDPDGHLIPLEVLSSGEQHQLVMLFRLLFEIEVGTLVLIDEPEISLHIAWAQRYIRDLANITQLAAIDVLIATHSPDLIHDRWDLTVELKGPDLD